MASTTYDFPPVSVNGQIIAIDRLLNNPILIYRALRTIAQQNLIGDRILTGRVNLTGSGSGIYEIAEKIFPDFLPLVVPPLSEYPNTTATPGTVSTVQPVKWGQGFDFSDRMRAHGKIDIMRRNMMKVANQLVFNSDQITLSVVASAVTQTFTALNGAWGTAGSTPFADVIQALAVIKSLNMGYNPDTVILTPTKYAQLVSSPTVLGSMPRESSGNLTLTGNMNQLASLNIWQSTNLPAGVNGIILDSGVLGSQAYEDLGSVDGANYVGTPGSVETAVLGLPTRDGWRVQARIVKAPMVQEPASALKLQGI